MSMSRAQRRLGESHRPDWGIGARGAGSNRLQDPACFPSAPTGNIGSPEHLHRGWRPGELEGLGDFAAVSRQQGSPVRRPPIIAGA